jgi:hypothetical protein
MEIRHLGHDVGSGSIRPVGGVVDGETVKLCVAALLDVERSSKRWMSLTTAWTVWLPAEAVHVAVSNEPLFAVSVTVAPGARAAASVPCRPAWVRVRSVQAAPSARTKGPRPSARRLGHYATDEAQTDKCRGEVRHTRVGALRLGGDLQP